MSGHIDPKTGFPPVAGPGPPPPPPPPPKLGPCTDPCEYFFNYQLAEVLTPEVQSAVKALWSLQTSLGVSNTPANPNAIDRIAAALEDLDQALRINTSAAVGWQFTAFLTEMQCLCASLKAIASASATGGGGFDPQVAAQLKRIADDFDILVKPQPPVASDKALIDYLVGHGLIDGPLGQIIET